MTRAERRFGQVDLTSSPPREPGWGLPARLAEASFEPWAYVWALPELVEAAARTGDAELARDALQRLEEATQPCGTDWALGIEGRSQALITEGHAAESLHCEAIDRLGRTLLRPELAPRAPPLRRVVAP